MASTYGNTDMELDASSYEAAAIPDAAITITPANKEQQSTEYTFQIASPVPLVSQNMFGKSKPRCYVRIVFPNDFRFETDSGGAYTQLTTVTRTSDENNNRIDGYEDSATYPTPVAGRDYTYIDLNGCTEYTDEN